MKTIHDPRYVRLIEHLKARRLALRLTQEQVTRQLHVPRSWMGKIEQRERKLDFLEAWRLCRLYGVSIGEIEKILSVEEKRP